MNPEVGGLTEEEAALIDDILTRLQLNNSTAQTTRSQYGASDPELEQLDLEEKAIEQELRGMRCGSPPAPLVALALPAHAPYQLSLPADPIAAYAPPAASATPPPPAPAERVPPAAAAAAEGLPGEQRPSVDQAPPKATSLLREMREQMRKQQQGGASASAPAGDTEAPQPNSSYSSYASVAALERAAESARSPARESGGHAGGAAAAPTNSARRPAAAAARTSAVFAPSPASASKAFTMLNARSDRYISDPSSRPLPAKAPVKLPEQERSSRLQQLYSRTYQWRRRCEERQAQARHDIQASELEACTFSPQITTASALMVQGKPPSEVYQAISKWATPTKHSRSPTSEPVSSAPASAARRSGGSPAGPSYTGTAAGGGGAAGHAAGSSASTTPSRGAAASSTEAAARLYKRALELRARHEERLYRQLLEEDSQRRFVASVQGVNPRVYQPAEPSPARHLPTGMEECTFHPRTRYRVASARASRDGETALHQPFHPFQFSSHFASGAAGASHARSPPTAAGAAGRGAASRSHAAASHGSSFAGFRLRPKSAPPRPRDAATSGTAHPQQQQQQRPAQQPRDLRGGGPARPGSAAFSAAGGGGTGHTSTTVHIAPELDWDEFLARQGRFLADREHKLQVLEQVPPLVPHMSPGSKKLVRQREARQRLAARAEGAEGEGGAEGVQGEASARSGLSPPGRPDRRVRTVMEMYRECTFQPQITNRAAAMPGRSLEDFVEGGRSRREEWMGEQRALQQLREVEGVTFKPQTFTKDNAYLHVRPRINLKNPDAYLAHVAQKRRQREALSAELAVEREALELQHCTFKPQTTPLPPYLIRRLQEQQLGLLAQQQQQQEQEQYELEAAEGDQHLGGGVGSNAAAFDPGLGYGQHDNYGELDAAYYSPYLAEALEAGQQDDADAAYQRALQYAFQDHT